MEWAIVFPVFFMLLYALISYGVAFLVRESMQLAAEDGARAALRYQPSREKRLATASSVVQQQLSWLPQSLKPADSQIRVDICRLGQDEECSVNLRCAAGIDERCFVSVQLEIFYGHSPLIPEIPYVGAFIPQTLTASASVLVDAGGI